MGPGRPGAGTDRSVLVTFGAVRPYLGGGMQKQKADLERSTPKSGSHMGGQASSLRRNWQRTFCFCIPAPLVPAHRGNQEPERERCPLPASRGPHSTHGRKHPCPIPIPTLNQILRIQALQLIQHKHPALRIAHRQTRFPRPYPRHVWIDTNPSAPRSGCRYPYCHRHCPGSGGNFRQSSHQRGCRRLPCGSAGSRQRRPLPNIAGALVNIKYPVHAVRIIGTAFHNLTVLKHQLPHSDIQSRHMAPGCCNVITPFTESLTGAV